MGNSAVTASSPGNLFFLGEHAVVYGFPSINVSVGRRTTAIAKKKSSNEVEISSREFGRASAVNKNGLCHITKEHAGLEPLVSLADFFVRKFGISDGFEINVSSEIPVESGMSSSTAVLSSVLKSLSTLFSLEIRNDEYFEILYPFQVKIHGGKASGSEIISSSVGGFNIVKKVEKNGHASLECKSLGMHEFSVVVGNTRVRAPTSLTVGIHIPSIMKRKPEFVNGSFCSIERLVNSAVNAIEKEDVQELGNIMNENQKILSALMLSHPKLDDCITEALNAGALGAKLSGGGWGGVMLALVRKGDEKDVARAIESTGSEAIITEIGVPGAIAEK